VRTSTSARDIEVFLGERILRGRYAPGSDLPPMRELAAELGTSPSTISRALRELERQGLVKVLDRRGAFVPRTLPSGAVLRDDVAAELRRVLDRLALAGWSRDDADALVAQAMSASYSPPRRIVFTECNHTDLAEMAEQVATEIGRSVDAVLLHELDPDSESLRNAAIVVPMFHVAEAHEVLGDHPMIVPVGFAPSDDVVLSLASIPRSQQVGVIGINPRSQRRLEALARQYVAGTVRSCHVDDAAKLAAVCQWADVVVTTHAAVVPTSLTDGSRIIMVEFALDSPGLAAKLA
jgi:GntR family transcriptional regulator